ncbi:hypothetical protein P5673_010584 [Acropora cervicornis]|uniref:Uncharacterized protein n=1 Tax=Acropora cervicornis TaxID=6130 RepID=A0AAD9V8S3_ACRCE|nr:hypothetical protein P5673_010584 [Acropora cervicornis]
MDMYVRFVLDLLLGGNSNGRAEKLRAYSYHFIIQNLIAHSERNYFILSFVSLAVASKQQRKIRDILGFFKKAGENAIKAISGLIPGSRPCSQMNTQPRGPKIPLNTINEDAIKPVIPYKRNEIQKSRNRSATKGKGIETV